MKVFMDCYFIYSKSLDHGLHNLSKVLERSEKVNSTLNLKKQLLYSRRHDVLSHVISSRNFSPSHQGRAFSLMSNV